MSKTQKIALEVDTSDPRFNPIIDANTYETLNHVRNGLEYLEQMLSWTDMESFVLEEKAVTGMFDHVHMLNGAIQFEMLRLRGEK